MKKPSLNVVSYTLIAFLTLGGSVSGGILSANLLAQSFFDNGAMQDLQQEEESNRQFQDQKKNEIRHLTDRARECKEKTRQVRESQKNNASQNIAEIAKQVAAFCSAVEKGKKALQSATNQEELEDLRNELINPEINDAGSDLNELLNDLNARNDLFRGLKENKRTCQNFARSMKDVARQAKHAKIDISALLAEGNAKVKECETNYKQISDNATAGQWEEGRDLLQDYFWNNELHESFNQIRETIQSCSEIGRIVSEVDQGKKQVERAIKQFKQKNLDTTNLETIFSDALEIISEARTLAKAGTCDRDAIEDVKSRLDDAGQNLDAEMEDLKEQADGRSSKRDSYDSERNEDSFNSEF